MLTIRIRADMRFKVCSTLLNHSLPARDALTRVFQGMPVCQVMYKETLTSVLRILQFSVPLVKLMALQFSWRCSVHPCPHGRRPHSCLPAPPSWRCSSHPCPHARRPHSCLSAPPSVPITDSPGFDVTVRRSLIAQRRAQREPLHFFSHSGHVRVERKLLNNSLQIFVHEPLHGCLAAHRVCGPCP